MRPALPRVTVWLATLISALSPHLCGVYYEGGTRYFSDAVREAPIPIIVGVELWLVSPVLFIAFEQRLVGAGAANSALAVTSVGIAGGYVVVFWWLYKTWVIGLFVLLAPVVAWFGASAGVWVARKRMA